MRPNDVLALSASEAAAAIREGRLTSRALVGACLERIRERDPEVHAFVRLAADAMDEAEAADRGEREGALRGVPVGIKDIMDTAGLGTEHGSSIWEGHVPERDAACVARLKAAGAIVIGKTATTEFAHVTPQATRNPLDLRRTPGGSSSGTAAAVASGMVPIALGTQTGGSVIRPASYCGLYGFKSSIGRTDVTGVHPLAPSLDTVGWFARSPQDLVLLGSLLLAGYRAESAERQPRLAIASTPYDHLASAAALEAPRRLARKQREAGFDVSTLALPEIFGTLNLLHRRLVPIEAYRAMRDYLEQQPGKLSPALRSFLETGRDAESTYEDVAHEVEVARGEFARLMDGIDALILPAATGEAPLGLESTGDASFSLFWSLLGPPCATLPLGRGETGMPIGVQLVGRFGEDEGLLALVSDLAEHADRESIG